MKTFVNIVILIFVLFGFSQCGNSQKIVEDPPFVLGEVMAEDWVAGVKGGGSGTNLFIPVEKGKEILLDSVYFRGKSVKLEKVQRDTYLVYIGRFKSEVNQKKDIILHKDPKKEVGNEPPKLKKKIPFQLKDDEAVVSYQQKKKTYYYKIEGIKEAPTVKLP